jgi:hypothetical protein
MIDNIIIFLLKKAKINFKDINTKKKINIFKNSPTLIVKNSNFYREIVLKGSLGLGETYEKLLVL